MTSRLMNLLVMAVFCVSPFWATAAELPGLDLDHPSRTAEEKARDVNRKPLETLAFFGIREDMRVIELFPGGGWYTKLLGPYLEEQGQLHIALGAGKLAAQLEEFGLGKVNPTGKIKGFIKSDSPGYIYAVEDIDLVERNVDMVLTFRNAHNLNSEARMVLNRAVFEALKPGGIYGVVDHTKRHMEKFEATIWRRIDPVLVIKEAVAAGFEFIDYTTIHARPEDNLQHDSRHESLPNESDRFTLKFRKPVQ